MVIKSCAHDLGKVFPFCVLRGNTYPKSSVFDCRCFLFFVIRATWEKCFLSTKEETIQIETKSRQGMIKYIGKDVKR